MAPRRFMPEWPALHAQSFSSPRSRVGMHWLGRSGVPRPRRSGKPKDARGSVQDTPSRRGTVGTRTRGISLHSPPPPPVSRPVTLADHAQVIRAEGAAGWGVGAGSALGSRNLSWASPCSPLGSLSYHFTRNHFTSSSSLPTEVGVPATDSLRRFGGNLGIAISEGRTRRRVGV